MDSDRYGHGHFLFSDKVGADNMYLDHMLLGTGCEMAQGRGYLEFASRSNCLCCSISRASNDVRVEKGEGCCESIVLMTVSGRKRGR